MGCKLYLKLSRTYTIYKFINIFLCLWFILSVKVEASENINKIFKTNNMLEIQDEIQYLGKDSLVIFDVSVVLFEQSNQLFQNQNKKLLDSVLKSLTKRMTITESTKLYSTCQKKEKKL